MPFLSLQHPHRGEDAVLNRTSIPAPLHDERLWRIVVKSPVFKAIVFAPCVRAEAEERRPPVGLALRPEPEPFAVFAEVIPVEKKPSAYQLIGLVIAQEEDPVPRRTPSDGAGLGVVVVADGLAHAGGHVGTRNPEGVILLQFTCRVSAFYWDDDAGCVFTKV